MLPLSTFQLRSTFPIGWTSVFSPLQVTGIKPPELVSAQLPPASSTVDLAGDWLCKDDSWKDFVVGLADKRIAGEVAGNIHHPEFDKFWSEALKPDLWTARVRSGYKLSFIGGQWPEAYRENNGKSAVENMDFVWDQLMDWNRKGVVISQSEPHCVSPLSVASRLMEDEEVKRRLCLDLSHHINKLIKKSGQVIQSRQGFRAPLTGRLASHI